MGCGSSSTKYDPALLPKRPDGPPVSEAFSSLLGPKLLSKNGEMDTLEALAGAGAVAIYFSAHWCPPCRGFTPALAKAYMKDLRAKGLEIVFVSSDQSDKSFVNYYQEMPWLAVPFAASDVKEALSKKFKVKGIPSLVILDSQANTITTDGRSKVASDPQGQDFPWRPKPFAEILGDSFLGADGTTVGKEATAGKTLGIYFSAHWCPPCRGFTPKLAQHYKAYREAGLPFEVVFVSSDRDQASFDDYRAEMSAHGGTWLSVPFADSRLRDLNSHFEVNGIPCLVIVDEQGCVVNKNARAAVTADTTGAQFPWSPPAVGDLGSPEGIEDTPSLCVLMEGVAADRQKAIAAELQHLAERHASLAKARGEDPKVLFFAATSAAGAVPDIRRLCGLPADGASEPAVLLLDIDDDGAFYRMSDSSNVAEGTIEEFLKAYEAKSLERLQLKDS